MAGIMFDPLFMDDANEGILPSNACSLDVARGQSEGEGEWTPAPAEEAPEPDRRTPIQKLLERFDLEEDQTARAQVAYWNDVEQPENKEKKEAMEADLEGRKAHLKEQPRQLQNFPDADIERQEAEREAAAIAQIDAETKAPIAVDSDADVHISESAIPFPKWHLDAEPLATVTYYQGPNDKVQPDEYRSPWPFEQPGRSVEEIDREGPTAKDPFARMVECVRLARSMIPEVPVKPKGKKGAAPAGTLGYVIYPVRATEGWMYIEDPQSDYGAWFQELILRKYKDAKEKFDTLAKDDTVSRGVLMAARYAMRQAAACIAIANQEGAPSAINTYDGLVLSWGIGIAGPGKLPKTFAEITKDPRVYKALYLCGFRYEGTVMNGEHHGAYQIVDVESNPPAVVYRDQWNHKPGAKKYDFEGHAYRVLKYMTLQPKLIHLLIQLAKDPLTRSVIFEPNYQMIEGFVSFVRADEIHTEALHIFVSQVKHNWGFGSSLVGWAISRFDDYERATFSAPDAPPTSFEKDQAIAKGIVRYLMGRLQEQRWKRGIKLMELEDKGKLKDLSQSAKGKFLYRLPATTEFGFDRLMKSYWENLKLGPRAQTFSSQVGTGGLQVPNFPKEVQGQVSGRYVWIQVQERPKGSDRRPPPKYYDLGPLSQFDLLFPHEEIKMLGLEGDKVLIDDQGQKKKVPRDLPPSRGGAR